MVVKVAEEDLRGNSDESDQKSMALTPGESLEVGGVGWAKFKNTQTN